VVAGELSDAAMLAQCADAEQCAREVRDIVGKLRSVGQLGKELKVASVCCVGNTTVRLLDGLAWVKEGHGGKQVAVCGGDEVGSGAGVGARGYQARHGAKKRAGNARW
jgi:hypothetical protein